MRPKRKERGSSQSSLSTRRTRSQANTSSNSSSTFDDLTSVSLDADASVEIVEPVASNLYSAASANSQLLRACRIEECRVVVKRLDLGIVNWPRFPSVKGSRTKPFRSRRSTRSRSPETRSRSGKKVSLKKDRKVVNDEEEEIPEVKEKASANVRDELKGAKIDPDKRLVNAGKKRPTIEESSSSDSSIFSTGTFDSNEIKGKKTPGSPSEDSSVLILEKEKSSFSNVSVDEKKAPTKNSKRKSEKKKARLKPPKKILPESSSSSKDDAKVELKKTHSEPRKKPSESDSKKAPSKSSSRDDSGLKKSKPTEKESLEGKSKSSTVGSDLYSSGKTKKSENSFERFMESLSKPKKSLKKGSEKATKKKKNPDESPEDNVLSGSVLGEKKLLSTCRHARQSPDMASTPIGHEFAAGPSGDFRSLVVSGIKPLPIKSYKIPKKAKKDASSTPESQAQESPASSSRISIPKESLFEKSSPSPAVEVEETRPPSKKVAVPDEANAEVAKSGNNCDGGKGVKKMSLSDYRRKKEEETSPQTEHEQNSEISPHSGCPVDSSIFTSPSIRQEDPEQEVLQSPLQSNLVQDDPAEEIEIPKAYQPVDENKEDGEISESDDELQIVNFKVTSDPEKSKRWRRHVGSSSESVRQLKKTRTDPVSEDEPDLTIDEDEATVLETVSPMRSACTLVPDVEVGSLDSQPKDETPPAKKDSEKESEEDIISINARSDVLDMTNYEVSDEEPAGKPPEPQSLPTATEENEEVRAPTATIHQQLSLLPENVRGIALGLIKKGVCYNAIEFAMCDSKINCKYSHYLEKDDIMNFCKLISGCDPRVLPLAMRSSTKLPSIRRTAGVFFSHCQNLSENGEYVFLFQFMNSLFVDIFANLYKDREILAVLNNTVKEMWNIFPVDSFIEKFKSRTIYRIELDEFVNCCYSSLKSIFNVFEVEHENPNPDHSQLLRLLWLIHINTTKMGIVFDPQTNFRILDILLKFEPDGENFIQMLNYVSHLPNHVLDLRFVVEAINIVVKAGNAYEKMEALVPVIMSLKKEECEKIDSHLLQKLVFHCVTNFEESTRGLRNRLLFFNIPRLIIDPTGPALCDSMSDAIQEKVENGRWNDLGVMFQSISLEKTGDQSFFLLSLFKAVCNHPDAENVGEKFIKGCLLKATQLLPVQELMLSQFTAAMAVHLFERKGSKSVHPMLRYAVDTLKLFPYRCKTFYDPQEDESEAILQRTPAEKVMFTCLWAWADGGQSRRRIKIIKSNMDVIQLGDDLEVYMVIRHVFESLLYSADGNMVDVNRVNDAEYLLYEFIAKITLNEYAIRKFATVEEKIEAFAAPFNMLFRALLQATKGRKLEGEDLVRRLKILGQKFRGNVVFDAGNLRGFVHLLQLRGDVTARTYFRLGVTLGYYPEQRLETFQSDVQVPAYLTHPEIQALMEESFNDISKLLGRNEIVRLFQETHNVSDKELFEKSGINNYLFGIKIVAPSVVVKTSIPFIDAQSVTNLSAAKNKVLQVLAEFKPKIQVGRTPAGREADLVIGPLLLIRYLYLEVLGLGEDTNEEG